MVAFDMSISQLITSAMPHNTFMDMFFSLFALRGALAYLWALPVLFVFTYEEVHHHMFIVRMSIVTVTNYALFTLLKILIARPRPFLQAGTVLFNKQLSLACPTDFSFPSGHATIAVGVAVVMAQTDKKRRMLYYVLAFLICLSRIYLQCHYVGDVISGAILGYVVAIIVCKYVRVPKKKKV
ncbi:MAG: phosphatase PAP2 family protein [Candidatus Roizmanbacteria bacterium]|nr:phosphatase PAP2 family protein [Candidatus Roizmanbacteria bacterium]